MLLLHVSIVKSGQLQCSLVAQFFPLRMAVAAPPRSSFVTCLHVCLCVSHLVGGLSAADGSELETAAPGTMVNMVARLEAFAGMSRMKRLALVVLCHTVTDKHLARLKVTG